MKMKKNIGLALGATFLLTLSLTNPNLIQKAEAQQIDVTCTDGRTYRCVVTTNPDGSGYIVYKGKGTTTTIIK
jgi:hypothetical protein